MMDTGYQKSVVIYSNLLIVAVGTFKLSTEEEIECVVQAVLQEGLICSIDTARVYRNEEKRVDFSS